MTGPTSGIGEATAKQLAEHGAHVIVAGRRRELGDGIVAAIRTTGGKADYVRAEAHHLRWIWWLRLTRLGLADSTTAPACAETSSRYDLIKVRP